MRRTLACSLVVFLTGCSAVGDRPDQHASSPNLVFIIADQWRGQALGFLGQEKVETPHLDALARESLVFTEAVSNYPVCSPYRAMLLSGQYPFRNGVYSNCNSQTTPFGCELKQTTRCWSDVLAKQGYSMAYVGKWHLESPREPFVESYNNRPNFAWNEWTPPERRHGFAFWHAYNTFDRHLKPEYWETTMSRDDRLKVDRWGPEHEADVAIKYLRNAGGSSRIADRPFAMVVSMNPPHMPYGQVPQRYIDRYAGVKNSVLLGGRPDLQPVDSRWGRYTRRNLRLQYAMMTGVDEQIGRILQALEDLGLADDTIVVFTSDHGDCLGLQGKISKNNHYELAMRVPLIVRWKRGLPARRDDLLISVPDLYPTLLGLMGLGDQVPDEVEGVNHAGLFRSGRGRRPAFQLYMWCPPGKLAEGRRGVRTHRYTLVVDRTGGKPEKVVLRDRQADPYQMQDFATDRPEVVRALRDQQLVPLLRRIGDPWLSRR
ncbi:MAG: sulfatase [Planctomycetota bacterium]|nr:sulfatase [Planctomycetota bacterium]